MRNPRGSYSVFLLGPLLGTVGIGPQTEHIEANLRLDLRDFVQDVDEVR